MKKESKKTTSPKKTLKNVTKVKSQVSNSKDAQKLQQEVYKAQYMKAIYSWVSTIALFSVVNSVLDILSIPLSFPIGLGINYFVTAILTLPTNGFDPSPSTVTTVGLFVALFFSGILFILGQIFKKGKNWAIYLLLIFYSLDTLLFFALISTSNGSWFVINIGFHLYAIYRIIRLLKVYRKL